MTAPLLELTGVSKRFGGLTAVEGLDLTIDPGEVVGLIGPNGAGKTTAFNLITGVYPLTTGTIRVAGHPTAGLTPDRITALGVARTFQNIRLFRDMTVVENVKTAMDLGTRYGLLAAILHTPRMRARERQVHDHCLALLELLDLAHVAHERAGGLAYGKQRRLEVARALATAPKLLILDEPAAGMNPQETEALSAMLRTIRERFAVSLLLIEHDMKFVMRMCERIVVLDYGRVIARGTPDEVRANPDVIAAYLGDAAAADATLGQE